MRKKNATQTVTPNFKDFGYEYTPNNPVEDINYNVSRDRVNPLVAGLEKASNVTVTENAAKAYKNTMNYLLDFFGNAGAMRKRPETDIIQIFSKAFAENRLLALKCLFYIRDVRGGMGERRTFRICLKWIADNYPDVVKKNIANIPLYGRWDDLYTLFGTIENNAAMEIMANQLAADWHNMKSAKNVSLLAKWLKSENTSSPASRNLGHKFREALGWSSKKYRKTLSALRKYIDVVEVKMCAREWNEINFEHTPSKALLNYRKAFEKRANESFTDYLKRVERGEATIATGALYPYDILRTVVETGTAGLALKTADLQWRNLPNYLEGDGKGLVIADTSGSMHGLPLYVAISLAIYFSERNIGPFKDVFMTFSQNPCFHRLIGNNILEKWSNLNRGGWDCNTDLQAAFDLILSAARANRVSKKDMPEYLLIVSDMQFDMASSNNDKTNFEVMKQKFESSGYKLPKTIWWQVDARQNNVPITFSDNGTALVSGSHPSILKKIFTTKFLSPLALMMETITDKRYDSVVA